MNEKWTMLEAQVEADFPLTRLTIGILDGMAVNFFNRCSTRSSKIPCLPAR